MQFETVRIFERYVINTDDGGYKGEPSYFLDSDSPEVIDELSNKGILLDKDEGRIDGVFDAIAALGLLGFEVKSSYTAYFKCTKLTTYSPNTVLIQVAHYLQRGL